MARMEAGRGVARCAKCAVFHVAWGESTQGWWSTAHPAFREHNGGQTAAVD